MHMPLGSIVQLACPEPRLPKLHVSVHFSLQVWRPQNDSSGNVVSHRQQQRAVSTVVDFNSFHTFFAYCFLLQFGTTFVEMDALSGRHQTTRGVWLAKCAALAADCTPFSTVCHAHSNMTAVAT